MIDPNAPIVSQQTPLPPPQPLPAHHRFINPWIFFAIVYSVVLGIVFFTMPVRWWDDGKELINRYIFQGDYVVVMNQSLGSQMIVLKARLSKPGFVVAWTASDLGGPSPYSFTSSYFPKGEYANIPIDLTTDTPEHFQAQSGRLIYVTIFYDDGDKIFDVATDTLAKTIFDTPVMTSATLQ